MGFLVVALEADYWWGYFEFQVLYFDWFNRRILRIQRIAPAGSPASTPMHR